MSTRGALAVVAAIVLAAGVLLALLPVSVADGVGCGSAISPEPNAAMAAEFGASLEDAFAGGTGDADGGFQALCEDRVTAQRLAAFPLVGIGVLALVFLALNVAAEAGQRAC